jgi:hypothetical protein
MILKILAASIVALGLGLYAERASAGQTFMCEDGRLLQVEQKDLERMKREEPCIAAYFGVAVQSVPLPIKRPLVVVSGLKGTNEAEPGKPAIGNLAQVSTDYRRVRIINARPGEQSWFRHRR